MIGERSPRRPGLIHRRLAETNFHADVSANSRGAFLQRSRMPAPMKDRQYPDLVFSDDVVNPVELEPMYWRPTHVGKSDSMMRSGTA